MRSFFLFGLLSVALSQTPVAQQQVSAPKTIRIDGAERPELIPDHWIWRASFLRLAETKKQGGEAAMAYDLPLSPADAAAVYAEAAHQPGRDAECRSRFIARQEALRQQNASPAATSRALDEVTLDCRTKDLDAADAVLDAVTDDGRRILTDWIERRRRTIVVFVPEQDMETFRLPR